MPTAEEAPSAPSRNADVLLVTATITESRALLAAAARRNGAPSPEFDAGGVTMSLGPIGGARVVHVQCQAGSTTVGGSLITVANAIQTLNPRSVVCLGVAFGVDNTRQAIGDILVSRRLAVYEPQRVGADSDGKRDALDRGDVVTASPRLLNLFDASTVEYDANVTAGLVLSGEKLLTMHRRVLSSLAVTARQSAAR